MNLESFKSFTPIIRFTNLDDAGFPITIIQEWEGPRVRTRLRNDGDRPVGIHEVVMADVRHGMPGDTKVYGEGFTHLSATGGTIAQPVDIGSYTDRDHYRLPEPDGARTVYGMLLLSPPGGLHVLIGFSTCLCYCGKLHLTADGVQAVLETEDISIDAGEVWYLEDMVFLQGADRAEVLAEFADRLVEHHRADCMPDLPPSGWCSWYCFRAEVTAEDVRANQEFIRREVPQLEFIQIDDGYQAAMGDWLETGSAFGGGIHEVIREIRDRGSEPAIWVAPFVAQRDSKVFSEHPHWFLKDDDGNPLSSDRVTFGGWRCGPWYALDPTNPQVQMHLNKVFSTMRFEWGIKYFKLDACYWGAMQGGRRFDPKATKIRAYRMGMRSVQRGADWTYILGCNHPTWPSMGICQGSRTSDDISRTWERFRSTGRQNLMRSWLNGKTWWNDPDCVVLTGDLSEEEFQFHATVMYASGGAVISGDDLPSVAAHRLEMLRKMLPTTGTAAQFGDDSLSVGTITLPEKTTFCLFNWEDAPSKVSFTLESRCAVRNFWTDQDIGTMEGLVEMELGPHCAKLLECRQLAD